VKEIPTRNLPNPMNPPRVTSELDMHRILKHAQWERDYSYTDLPQGIASGNPVASSLGTHVPLVGRTGNELDEVDRLRHTPVLNTIRQFTRYSAFDKESSESLISQARRHSLN
jgi:hypothetical protein